MDMDPLGTMNKQLDAQQRHAACSYDAKGGNPCGKYTRARPKAQIHRGGRTYEPPRNRNFCRAIDRPRAGHQHGDTLVVALILWLHTMTRIEQVKGIDRSPMSELTVCRRRRCGAVIATTACLWRGGAAAPIGGADGGEGDRGGG